MMVVVVMCVHARTYTEGGLGVYQGRDKRKAGGDTRQVSALVKEPFLGPHFLILSISPYLGETLPYYSSRVPCSVQVTEPLKHHGMTLGTDLALADITASWLVSLAILKVLNTQWA